VSLPRLFWNISSCLPTGCSAVELEALMKLNLGPGPLGKNKFRAWVVLVYATWGRTPYYRVTEPESKNGPLDQIGQRPWFMSLSACTQAVGRPAPPRQGRQEGSPARSMTQERGNILAWVVATLGVPCPAQYYCDEECFTSSRWLLVLGALITKRKKSWVLPRVW